MVKNERRSKNEIDITLLHRYLANECSEKEQKLVRQWINRSETNRDYFQSLKKIWTIYPQRNLPVDPEKAWRNFKKNI